MTIQNEKAKSKMRYKCDAEKVGEKIVGQEKGLSLITN